MRMKNWTYISKYITNEDILPTILREIKRVKVNQFNVENMSSLVEKCWFKINLPGVKIWNDFFEYNAIYLVIWYVWHVGIMLFILDSIHIFLK